ncbi:MAG: hypothetical protein R3C10_18275 [Pirellulales bacterium]
MATDSLVMELKDSGTALLKKLRQSGFNVTAAAWVKVSVEDRWVLYIATNLVDSRGQTAAYRDLYAALAGHADFWSTIEGIRLISTSDPIAVSILALRQKTPANIPINFGGRTLGGKTIDAAYIYPA